MSPHRPIALPPRRRSSSSSTTSSISTSSIPSISLNSPTSSTSSMPSSPGRHTTLKHQNTFLASYLSHQNATTWEWRWEDGRWQIKSKPVSPVADHLDRLAEECMDEVIESVRRDQEPWGR